MAHTGECAYQFTGNKNVLSSISQVYNLDGIGEPGDQMRMSAWIKGKNITVGGKLRAIVKFPTAPKAILTIKVIEGTYEYTQVHSNTVNLNEAPKSVTIRAQMGSGSGKYLLDDLAVQTVANLGVIPDTFSALAPLPVPQAETGDNLSLRKLR